MLPMLALMLTEGQEPSDTLGKGNFETIRGLLCLCVFIVWALTWRTSLFYIRIFYFTDFQQGHPYYFVTLNSTKFQDYFVFTVHYFVLQCYKALL